MGLGRDSRFNAQLFHHAAVHVIEVGMGIDLNYAAANTGVPSAIAMTSPENLK